MMTMIVIDDNEDETNGINIMMANEPLDQCVWKWRWQLVVTILINEPIMIVLMMNDDINEWQWCMILKKANSINGNW